MRICIYGAGAIGGYLGVQLSLAGHDVTLIARGPHLEAMRAKGLKLLIGDEERIAHPHCTDDPSEAGPQDYVIVTLKAHSVPRGVDAMQPLLGPDTAVVSAVNGVPWWYFYKLEGPWEDRRIESVDPGGARQRAAAAGSVERTPLTGPRHQVCIATPQSWQQQLTQRLSGAIPDPRQTSTRYQDHCPDNQSTPRRVKKRRGDKR